MYLCGFLSTTGFVLDPLTNDQVRAFIFSWVFKNLIMNFQKVLSVNCGGNKRSWDLCVSEHSTSFAFIRSGQVFLAQYEKDDREKSLIIQVNYSIELSPRQI
jgi:hypothetical protein